MNETLKRVITGLLLGPTVLGIIYWDAWGLLGICVIASLIGLAEFYQLLQLNLRAKETLITFGVAAFIWVVIALSAQLKYDSFGMLSLLALSMPTLSIVLLYKKDEQAAFQKLAYLFFGLQYILLPFLLMYLCSFEKFSHVYYAPIPMGILLLHWISDTAAYFSGRTFGRRKIFPRHSPKKSWEGFIAGLIITLFAGALFEHFWKLEQFNWISVAFITVVVGLFGDLVESMLKRNLNIKDSGKLLPGHGGFLDRFDGFFLAMPVIFIYYVVLGKFPPN